MRDGSVVDKKDVGFIAQELNKLQEEFGMKEYLNLVDESNPERLTVDLYKLIPILVKAIQELNKKIEDK